MIFVLISACQWGSSILYVLYNIKITVSMDVLIKHGNPACVCVQAYLSTLSYCICIFEGYTTSLLTPNWKRRDDELRMLTVCGTLSRDSLNPVWVNSSISEHMCAVVIYYKTFRRAHLTCSFLLISPTLWRNNKSPENQTFRHFDKCYNTFQCQESDSFSDRNKTYKTND